METQGISLLESLIRRLSLLLLYPAHRSIKGFTQVEIAVTILVIGILASISAPSFLKWQQQRNVDKAVIIFENAIRETQAEAIKRSRNCELRIRSVETISSRVPPPIEGDCILRTSDLDLVGLKLEHTYPPNPLTVWRIEFNARGENRTPPSATAIFSMPEANVKKCVVVSVGIGLHRSGRWDDTTNSCIKS
jgi:type II secretory pathway pseudopilin PulG